MRYTVMHFGGPIVLESVFPYAPANGGPMPQKICFCTLCRGLFGPIDARTVTSHKTKYGLVKHFVQDDKELSTDDDYSDIESEPSSPVASSSVAWADYHKWPYTHTDEDTNSKRSLIDAEGNSSTNNCSNVKKQRTHFATSDFHIESDESCGIQLQDDMEKQYEVGLDLIERSATHDDLDLSSQKSDHDDSTSDEILDTSDSEDEDGDTDSNDSISDNETDNVEKEVQWSFCYDKDKYSSDLAITKIPGTNTTILQWLCVNFEVFSSHPSISKTVFSRFLNLQANIFGHRNNIHLPSSYREARKLINPYLVEKKTFHACINDCVLFRNSEKFQYYDLTACPICNEARYIDNNAKHLVPRRKFMYIPLGPRIARIYGEVNLVQLIQSHPGNEYYSSEMWDIHHSPVWRNLYSEDGYFGGDKSGISLSFELDGVNPFHNIGVPYSMTPMMVTLLNLPRQERNRFSNMHLLGIIPGKANGKSEASNIGPYVEVVVDELLYLTQCKAYPEYTEAPVDVKIKLLLYILDYPGLSKLFNKLGSGSLSGCHWCHIRGIKCSHLDKVIYQNNRCYLDKNDPLRQETKTFADKDIEVKGKPALRNYEDEMRHRATYDNTANKTRASYVSTATGCKGEYVLMKLPGHNRLKESLPDGCHTIKDVTQNLMNIVTGRTVNMDKIIAAEKHKNRLHVISSSEHESRARHGMLTDSCHDDFRNEESVKNKRKKISENVPNAYPFSLTKNELQQADERAKNMNIPLGFGLKPSQFISKPGSLKSHDYKVLATEGILKFCLKDCLGKECRETLFLIFDSMAELCQEFQEQDELEAIEKRLNTALALLERNFPLHVQNITTHLLHHVPDGIREYGPVYSTWMYTFERFNSWLCKRTMNMRFPEATAVETYLIYDWCNFLKSSGRFPKDIATPLLPITAASEQALMEVEDSSADHRNLAKKYFKPSKQVEKLVHKYCGIKPGDICRNCAFRKYSRHLEMDTNTHRATTYTCAAKDRYMKSKSSYVCFEQERGHRNNKVTSGKYVCFGRISYFVEHENDPDGTKRFACVNRFSSLTFDQSTKMWHAEETPSDHKIYVDIKRISNPLITYIDNNCVWFLNSGKRPF